MVIKSIMYARYLKNNSSYKKKKKTVFFLPPVKSAWVVHESSSIGFFFLTFSIPREHRSAVRIVTLSKSLVDAKRVRR